MKKNNTEIMEETVETEETNVVELPKEETPAERKVHKFLGYEIVKAEKPVKEKKELKPKLSKKQLAARIVGGVAVVGAAGKVAFDLLASHHAGNGSDENGGSCVDGDPGGGTSVSSETNPETGVEQNVL